MTETETAAPAANCTACDMSDAHCAREYDRTDITCCARCEHPAA